MKRVRIDKILENTVPEKDILSEKPDDFYPELEPDEEERIIASGLKKLENGEKTVADDERFITGTVHKLKKKNYIFPAAAAFVLLMIAAASIMMNEKNKVTSDNNDDNSEVIVTEEPVSDDKITENLNTDYELKTGKGYSLEKIDIPENIGIISDINFYNDELFIKGTEKKPVSYTLLTLKNGSFVSEYEINLFPDMENTDSYVSDIYYDGETTYITGYIYPDDNSGTTIIPFLSKYINGEKTLAGTVYMDEVKYPVEDISFDHNRNEICVVADRKLNIFNTDLEQITVIDTEELSIRETGISWYCLQAETDSESNIYMILQSSEPENIQTGDYAVMKLNSNMECVCFKKYPSYLDSEKNPEISRVRLSELSDGGAGVFCEYSYIDPTEDYTVLYDYIADVFSPDAAEPETVEIASEHEGNLFCGVSDSDYIIEDGFYGKIDIKNIGEETIKQIYNEIYNPFYLNTYIHEDEEVRIVSSTEKDNETDILCRMDMKGEVIDENRIDSEYPAAFSKNGDPYIIDFYEAEVDVLSDNSREKAFRYPLNNYSMPGQFFSAYENFVIHFTEYTGGSNFRNYVSVYSSEGDHITDFDTDEQWDILTSRNNGDGEDIYYSYYRDEESLVPGLRRINTETGVSEEIPAVEAVLKNCGDNEYIQYCCSGGLYDIYIGINSSEWYGYSIEDDTAVKIFDVSHTGLSFADRVTAADSEGTLFCVSGNNIYRISH